MSTSGISFSGLASGLDTGKIIQQLVALEGIPIQQIEDKKKDAQAKLSTLGTLKGLVKDLQKQAKILSKQSEFLSFRTTLSTDGHVAVSASGSASAGSHTITVNQLATVDRWVFDGLPDATTPLSGTDGQVQFDVGGTSYTVPVLAAESSLEDIAAAINEEAGEDVAASVVNVGTSSNPSHQLVLTSKHSGVDARISSISSTIAGLTLDPLGPDVDGVAQSASNITVGLDAVAVIDGLTVTRETNEFNDVVTGLSITLQSADPDLDVAVSVEADTGAIKKKLKDFVTAFNGLIDFINVQSTYDKETGAGGKLFGDPILSSVRSQVREALFGVDLITVQNDTEGYSTLSLIGIESQNDGTLEVDDTVLDDKLAANLDALADLFVDSDGFDNGGAAANTPGYYTDTTADGGLADDLFRNIDRMLKTYTGPGGQSFKGLFDLRNETINAQITKFNKDIDAKQIYLDKFEDNLIQKFSKLEDVMAGLQAQGASLQASLLGLIG